MRTFPSARVIIILTGLLVFLGTLATPAAASVPTMAPYAEATGGIPDDVAVDGTYAYVASSSSTLIVLDISTPSDPQVVGSLAMPGIVRGVGIYGGYAFVACHSDGLHVVDINDPAHPTEVTHLDMTAEGVTVWAWWAFVAGGADGLNIVNIGTPTAPFVEGQLALPGFASKVAVNSASAYVVAGSAGIRRVDVTDKANPAEVGYFAVGGSDYTGVAVNGNYVYATTMGHGLYIIDARPGFFLEITCYANPEPFTDVAYSDGVAYVGTPWGLRLVDVSDPANPSALSELSMPHGPQHIRLYGDYAWVAASHGGLRIVSVTNTASPTMVGLYDPPGGAIGVAIKGSHIYLASSGAGVRVMDLGASTVTQVGAWGESGWAYDVAIGGNFLYVADATNGLSIANISNPDHPVSAGHVDDYPGTAMAVAVAGSHAYVLNDSTGLRVFDVSDPASATLVGSCAITGTVADVAVSGSYAYVAAQAGGLRIINISNPASPVEVAHLDPGAFRWTVGVAISGHYAYLAESPVLRVVDIADPLHPAEVSVTEMDSVDMSALDVDVYGRYAYVAGYGGGLRVYDIADPAHPVEVAWSPAASHSIQRVAAADGLICMSVYGHGIYVFTPPPGTVEGQVREAGTTTNIVGATVRVTGVRVTKQAITNGAGIYKAIGVPAGLCSVTATAPGYMKQTKAGIPVIGYEITYVNFNLPVSGRLSGQVKDRGTSASLVGATVSICRSGKLVTTRTATLNGIYSCNTDLSTGTYSLIASKNGYVAQAKANISVTQGQTTYVNFSLDRVCLAGQVRAAANGASLSGATVRATQDHLKLSATAGHGGIYEVGGLAAGTCTVTALKAGYVRQTKPNITITNGVITYVNFNLATSGKLMGQVKDKVSGDPLVGATVQARSAGVLRAAVITTAPFGIYEINADLPAGTYTMIGSNAGYDNQIKTNITVTAGETTYVNFNLASGG